MSRIGSKPIVLPAAVQLTAAGSRLSVKGPLGEALLDVHPAVMVQVATEEGVTTVTLSADPSQKQDKALWGTMRALLANAVKGVSEGFSRSLEVVGVGFRANVQGSSVVFDVGYSHPVTFTLPMGVSAKVEKNVVTVTGTDRQAVGETAARIRRIRQPEPYKGTGIKYTDETIRRKAGKTGKSAG
ncbi:50S ribosomal protein L6 [Candidatus Uhrbacteria bacterium]|nr:50S ribosomal protein L6 [Candidatus Uhrbacteria bacterium]